MKYKFCERDYKSNVRIAKYTLIKCSKEEIKYFREVVSVCQIKDLEYSNQIKITTNLIFDKYFVTKYEMDNGHILSKTFFDNNFLCEKIFTSSDFLPIVKRNLVTLAPKKYKLWFLRNAGV